MIYTSYFSKVKALAGKNLDLVFVSIAGKTPNWFDNSLIEIHKFKKLMPKYDWWSEWHDKFQTDLESYESISWYANKYHETILDNFDAKSLAYELFDLSDHKDIVLLCYETPEKFCHRHLVSKWFNDNNIDCEEI